MVNSLKVSLNQKVKAEGCQFQIPHTLRTAWVSSFMSAEVVHHGGADGVIGLEEMTHLDVSVPDHEAAAQGGYYDAQPGEEVEASAGEVEGNSVHSPTGSTAQVQSAPPPPTIGKPLPGTGGSGGGLAAACWCIS